MGGKGLLELVNDRRRFLLYLSENPAHKRDIVEALEVSRSTVDRAISELQGQQFIKRTDDGYISSKKGEASLQSVNTLLESLETLEEASEMVQCFSQEVEIPSCVFQNAEVYCVGPPAPISAAENVLERLKQADRLIGLSKAHTFPEWTEVLIERCAIKKELSVELVISSELAQFGLFDDGTWSDEFEKYHPLNNSQLYIGDKLKLGYFVLYDGDDAYFNLIGYGPHGEYRGHIETTNSSAIRWAENYFENIVDSSTPITELV